MIPYLKRLSLVSFNLPPTCSTIAQNIISPQCLNLLCVPPIHPFKEQRCDSSLGGGGGSGQVLEFDQLQNNLIYVYLCMVTLKFLETARQNKGQTVNAADCVSLPAYRRDIE